MLAGSYQALRHAAEQAKRYAMSMGSQYLAGGFAELGVHLRALRMVRGYVEDAELVGFEKAIMQLVENCGELCVMPEIPYVAPEVPAPHLISYRIFLRPDSWTRIRATSRSTNQVLLDGSEVMVDDTVDVLIASRAGGRIQSVSSSTSFNMQQDSVSKDAKDRMIRTMQHGVVPQEDVFIGAHGYEVVTTLSKLRSNAIADIERVHDYCLNTPKGPFKFKVDVKGYRIDFSTHPDTFEEWVLHRRRDSEFKLLVSVTCDCDRPFTQLKNVPGFPMEYFDPLNGNALHFIVDLPANSLTVLPDDEGLSVTLEREFSLLDYYDAQWHDQITHVVCSHANDGRLRIKPHIIAIPR